MDNVANVNLTAKVPPHSLHEFYRGCEPAAYAVNEDGRSIPGKGGVSAPAQ